MVLRFYITPSPAKPLKISRGILRFRAYNGENAMSSPDDLTSTLASWRVNPPADPAFRTAVRARLDSDESALSWPRFARRHAALVAGLLGVATVGGALGGQASARMRVAEARERLVSAYVQSLDARAMDRP
jgi:hypothetical protein